MDVLSKVSDNIKKKLTLQDYVSLNNKTESQHGGILAKQQDGKATQQPDSSPPEAPLQDSRAATKVKVTYYLTKEDNQRLTNIYIKNLQLGKKIDKSALIAAAIQLLAKKYDV